MGYSVYVISFNYENEKWELTPFGFESFDEVKVKPYKTDSNYSQIVQYVKNISKYKEIRVKDVYHQGIVSIEDKEVRSIFDKFYTRNRVEKLEELWNFKIKGMKIK